MLQPLLAIKAAPVDLVLDGYEPSEDGASLVLGVTAANGGERNYATVTAEVKFTDADGFVVGSGEVELAGWLPAGGSCSYGVEVALPQGAEALDLGAVAAAAGFSSPSPCPSRAPRAPSSRASPRWRSPT